MKIRLATHLIIIMAIVTGGILILGKYSYLNKQRPSIHVSNLLATLDEMNKSMGIEQVDLHTLNKTWYIDVWENLPADQFDSSKVELTIAGLKSKGWRIGKSRNKYEMTLCKGVIIIDIDSPSADVNPAASSYGYVGVSWGDASVRCPR